jgi:hypothetical protein
MSAAEICGINLRRARWRHPPGSGEARNRAGRAFSIVPTKAGTGVFGASGIGDRNRSLSSLNHRNGCVFLFSFFHLENIYSFSYITFLVKNIF